MSAIQHGNLTWLSWLSPLGWSQQTAPLVLNRWWPLVYSLVLTAVLVSFAYQLLDRRDLGSGIFSERLGSPRAPRWLGNPLALAYRLQRPSLIGWSVSLFLLGIVLGAFSQPMLKRHGRPATGDRPAHGRIGGLLDGYLGFMGLYFGIMVAVYAILSIQYLKTEEQGTRTEPVLSAADRRFQWLAAWTTVSAVGSLILMTLAGVGTAAGNAQSAAWVTGCSMGKQCLATSFR